MSRRYYYELETHEVAHGVKLEVADLIVDDRAQRSLSEQRAQKIADDWVPEASGSITVSHRGDGQKTIVDGQTRKRAMEILGIDECVCEVHFGLTVRDEATLFLLKNRESSKPQALDEYRIGLTAELPLFVDTDKVLKAHRLAVGTSAKNVVGAVQGVLRITDQYGPETLDQVLDVAEQAWGRTAETWDGMLLGGLGLFLGRHNEQANGSELAQRMGRKPAWAWKRDVLAIATNEGRGHSGSGSRVSACYHEIVLAYNKGRRNEAAKVKPYGRNR